MQHHDLMLQVSSKFPLVLLENLQNELLLPSLERWNKK
jgi:hypothetical protein